MHGGGHRSSQSLLGTVLEHDDPPTDAEEALPPPVPTSPFATTEWPGSALSSSSSLSRSQSLSATTFGDRRRRAAKLCQFFGVDHQTLGLSLFATQNLHIPPMEEQESRNLTVGVRVNMPPRPWSRGGSEPDMKEVEVTDVIDKLRCMKAS